MVDLTEIVTKIRRTYKGELIFCAIDNHNHKRGKSFDLLYSAKSIGELRAFMKEKGLK